MTGRRLRVLLVAAVILLTAACAPAAAPAAAAGAPAFTGRTLDGGGYDSAALAGRPAVLWFWAPWCATCASQADAVLDLHRTHGTRLGVVGVAGLGGNAEMHEFVADLGVQAVTHLDDADGVLWRRFGITEQSKYVLLDRTGAVVLTGYLDAVDLPARVRSLVG